jgi:hypothetical protein
MQNSVSASPSISILKKLMVFITYPADLSDVFFVMDSSASFLRATGVAAPIVRMF